MGRIGAQAPDQTLGRPSAVSTDLAEDMVAKFTACLPTNSRNAHQSAAGALASTYRKHKARHSFSIGSNSNASPTELRAIEARECRPLSSVRLRAINTRQVRESRLVTDQG